MEVVLVTGEYGKNGGGLSLSCFSFKEMLTRFGIKVFLVSSVYNRDDHKGFYLDDFYIEEGGYNKNLTNQLAFQAKLKEETKKFKRNTISFVIAFGGSSNGIFANELSQNIKSKLIVLTRGSDINLSLSDISLRYMNEIIFNNACKVISLSNELSINSQKISNNKSSKYEVIPLPIHTCKEFNLDIQNKDKFILGTGAKSLNEKKGVGNLIKMLYFLNKKDNRREYHMEFVGRIDDDLKYNYKKIISRFELDTYITFIGDLSREDFIFQMKKWDFYVQGSFCEAFSNSLIEYFSFGKPFMVTDTGFIPENLAGIADDIIFSSFNPSDMAQDFINLLEKPTFSDIFIKAYHHLFNVCSNENIEKKWMNIFNSQHVIKKTKHFGDFRNIYAVILHDISETYHSNIDTPQKVFESFVEKIVEHDYHFCSVKDYRNLNDKSKNIICTFDDGYIGVFDYAFPILKKYGFTATVFVCTDYIGKDNSWNLKDKTVRKHMSLEMLKTLYDEGWEIGSHGLTHRSLLRLNDDELKKELSSSKLILSQYFGDINSYSYPYGDVNQFCMNHVKTYYTHAFTLNQGGSLQGVDDLQIRRYFISDFNIFFD